MPGNKYTDQLLAILVYVVHCNKTSLKIFAIKKYLFQYIITDAVTTLLAIVTMFLLLRMECTQILTQAEELWQNQDPGQHSVAGR